METFLRTTFLKIGKLVFEASCASGFVIVGDGDFFLVSVSSFCKKHNSIIWG